LKLALGTAQFGLDYGIANRQGQVSHDEAKAILEHAWANGIDTLDTAIAYGESEQRLGEIGVQDWQVVSKLPAIPMGCDSIAQWVMDAVQDSLERLKVEKLHGLLLHQPQQLLEKDGNQLYRALRQLKKDGLVQKIGISIYAPSELGALCSRFQLDLVQAPFNIMDRRLIDTGWLSRLTEQGMEVQVRSIFLQGLLLIKPADRPRKFFRWATLWSRWDEWLEHTGLTPLQACVRYALSFSQISKVIFGVDSLLQLKEILMAAAASSPQVPDGLSTSDLGLLNPANWATINDPPPFTSRLQKCPSKSSLN
jgi:aryl-alcohol dehydrogenase-like predicted oxidoreductase